MKHRKKKGVERASLNEINVWCAGYHPSCVLRSSFHFYVYRSSFNLSVGVQYVRSMSYKQACVPSCVRKGRCLVWVFGETYGVGDEREKWNILMSGFWYRVEGMWTVCGDGFF